MNVKAERRVDTITVEMDLAVAEQLAEILFLVQDGTHMAQYYGSSILEIFSALTEDCDVRFPSSLYSATPVDEGILLQERV